MNLAIKELSLDYISAIFNFQTYEPELKRYLIFNPDSFVGYITLSCDSLRVYGELKGHFKDKNILYKTLPALKIGRLAVDDRYQRQGFGKTLVELALIFAKHINSQHCGCRFLILDAKRNKEPNKDSLHFYKALNFKILKEKDKGAMPMYLDILIETN